MKISCEMIWKENANIKKLSIPRQARKLVSPQAELWQEVSHSRKGSPWCPEAPPPEADSVPAGPDCTKEDWYSKTIVSVAATFHRLHSAWVSDLKSSEGESEVAPSCPTLWPHEL